MREFIRGRKRGRSHYLSPTLYSIKAVGKQMAIRLSGETGSNLLSLDKAMRLR